MKIKSTFRLFVTVCLLGGLVFLVDYRSRVNQKRARESHLIFDVATDPVTGIKIVRGESAIECIKKGHDWFLKEPVRARGNAAAIEQIAAMLEEARWTESISAEQREARGIVLADYGLESPEFMVTVESDIRSMVLFIGDALPMGNSIYARRNHSDEVLIVPASLGSGLPTSIESLRDSSVLHGKPVETVRVEIERKGAGFIQLVRQGGVWMIQQPLSARADAIEVQLLLANLYELKVETYIWDVRTEPLVDSEVAGTLEMASSARIESCGLAADAVQMRITVWVEGDSLGQEILLGKADPDNEGILFAKRGENNAIFGVDDDVLQRCGIDLNLLRDRRIFYAAEEDVGYIELKVGENRLVLERSLKPLSGWNIVDPVQWVADNHEVDELLKRISTLTVHSYLTQPFAKSNAVEIAEQHCSVVLRASAPVEDKSIADGDTLAGGGELVVGGMCDNNECCFAKMADRDEVFVVQVAGVDWLHRQETVSALSYRDRSMLKVNPGHVRRIEISKSSGLYGVERSSTQNWSCVVNKEQIPDIAAIRALLIVTSDLRAVSIEVHNPEGLDVYGLEAPFASITLGLQGEDNIQKSILLGKQSDDGRYYAMVRGQDIVFMVSKDVASKLLAMICVAGDDSKGNVAEVD